MSFNAFLSGIRSFKKLGAYLIYNLYIFNFILAKYPIWESVGFSPTQG